MTKSGRAIWLAVWLVPVILLSAGTPAGPARGQVPAQPALRSPESAEPRAAFMQANAEFKAGHYNRALGLYQDALAQVVDADHPEILNNIAATYRALNRPKEAAYYERRYAALTEAKTEPAKPVPTTPALATPAASTVATVPIIAPPATTAWSGGSQPAMPVPGAAAATANNPPKASRSPVPVAVLSRVAGGNQLQSTWGWSNRWNSWGGYVKWLFYAIGGIPVLLGLAAISRGEAGTGLGAMLIAGVFAFMGWMI